jgi:hypothetical protein
MLVEDSHNVEVSENHMTECGLGRETGFCFFAAPVYGNWGLYSSNISLTNNDFVDCSPQEAIIDFDQGIFGGGGLCVIAVYIDALAVNDNDIRQNVTWADFFGFPFPILEPALLTQFTAAVEVKGNTIKGGRVGLDDAEGVLFADNGFFSPNTPLALNSVDGLSVRHNRLEVTGDAVDGPSGLVPVGIFLRGQASVYRQFDAETGELLLEFVDNAPARNNLIANNRIIRDGIVGAEIFEACSNTFVGNNFEGQKLPVYLALRAGAGGTFGSIRFEQEFGGTGANTFAVSGTVIEYNPGGDSPLVGNGYLDCDGDGIGDSNNYVGNGKPATDGFGKYISTAVSVNPHPRN